MAKIEVTAFVSDWKIKTDEPNPEWAMKIREGHSKKNDADGWDIIGHTRWTVKAAYGVSIDFRAFKSGDRVKVTGKQVTEENGEYKNLVIKADSVEVLAASTRTHPAAGNVQTIADAPF
jgi:hypothetical protein